MDSKEKIFKILENSQSAGDMFRKLIGGKNYKEKYHNVINILYFASIENRNIKIRTKALAYIKFLKTMSIDPVWKEGKIINEFNGIELILEQNILEIIILLKTSDQTFINDSVRILLIQEILTLLSNYKINKELFSNFKAVLVQKFNLDITEVGKILTPDESFIYDCLSFLDKDIYS